MPAIKAAIKRSLTSKNTSGREPSLMAPTSRLQQPQQDASELPGQEICDLVAREEGPDHYQIEVDSHGIFSDRNIHMKLPEVQNAWERKAGAIDGKQDLALHNNQRLSSTVKLVEELQQFKIQEGTQKIEKELEKQLGLELKKQGEKDGGPITAKSSDPMKISIYSQRSRQFIGQNHRQAKQDSAEAKNQWLQADELSSASCAQKARKTKDAKDRILIHKFKKPRRAAFRFAQAAGQKEMALKTRKRTNLMDQISAEKIDQIIEKHRRSLNRSRERPLMPVAKIDPERFDLPPQHSISYLEAAKLFESKTLETRKVSGYQQMPDTVNRRSPSPSASEPLATPEPKAAEAKLEEPSNDHLIENFAKISDQLKSLIFTPEDRQDEVINNLKKQAKDELERLEQRRSAIQQTEPTKPRPWMSQYTPKMNELIGVADLNYLRMKERIQKEREERENSERAKRLQEKEIERQRRSQLRILDLLEQYYKLKKDVEELEYLKLSVPVDKLILIQTIYNELVKEGIEPIEEEAEEAEPQQIEAREQETLQKAKKTATKALLNLGDYDSMPGKHGLRAGAGRDDAPVDERWYAESVYVNKLQEEVDDVPVVDKQPEPLSASGAGAPGHPHRTLAPRGAGSLQSQKNSRLNEDIYYMDDREQEEEDGSDDEDEGIFEKS